MTTNYKRPRGPSVRFSPDRPIPFLARGPKRRPNLLSALNRSLGGGGARGRAVDRDLPAARRPSSGGGAERKQNLPNNFVGNLGFGTGGLSTGPLRLSAHYPASAGDSPPNSPVFPPPGAGHPNRGGKIFRSSGGPGRGVFPSFGPNGPSGPGPNRGGHDGRQSRPWQDGLSGRFPLIPKGPTTDLQPVAGRPTLRGPAKTPPPLVAGANLATVKSLSRRSHRPGQSNTTTGPLAGSNPPAGQASPTSYRPSTQPGAKLHRPAPPRRDDSEADPGFPCPAVLPARLPHAPTQKRAQLLQSISNPKIFSPTPNKPSWKHFR